MLVSVIDASVLEWFCALSGQYHSLTDGNIRIISICNGEKEGFLPLNGAAKNPRLITPMLIFFFRHLFFCGFWCEIKECCDGKHCAHCWPVVATDVKERCTLPCGDILVGGLWMGSKEEWTSCGWPKCIDLFFSGSVLPFNAPINCTWSKSKPVLPSKCLLKSNLIN